MLVGIAKNKRTLRNNSKDKDNKEKEVSVEKDPNNQLDIKEIAEAFVENHLQRNIAVRESSIAGEYV